MRHTWNFKFDLKSFIISFIPLLGVIYLNYLEDNLLYLFLSLMVALSTLLQVIRSRQKNVLVLENKRLYKKNVFGKVKEIDLTKFKEFSLDGFNKKNATLIGYIQEDTKISRKVLLRNEYSIPLENIKKTIEQSLNRSEFLTDEDNIFEYHEKSNSFSRGDKMAQEEYSNLIKIANVILAVCFITIVIITFVLLQNETEAVMASLLVIYTVFMFPFSKVIIGKDITVMSKRKQMLGLYIPGILLMIITVIMIMNN